MTHSADSALYFCMDDVLDAITRRRGSGAHDLVRVYTDPISSYIHEEDIFRVGRSDKLLDFSGTEMSSSLSAFSAQVPLYHINIELALDQALVSAEKDTKLMGYLEKAFGSYDAIKSLKKIVAGQENVIEETLNFPGLGYIYPEQICQIYIDFLDAIQNHEPYLDEYGFTKAVLRNYPERFLNSYEGFICPAEGRAKASWLFENGYRQDHSQDLQKQIDHYMQQGLVQAAHENLQTASQYLAAWLAADSYQLRRCLTIDKALKTVSIKDAPAWLREDVFKILEKESMKQHYAKGIMEQDPSSDTLEAREHLRLAIENNAKGLADPAIEEFMRQTLSAGKPQVDATSQFINLAESRLVESQDL